MNNSYKGKIVIIDDDEDIRFTISEICKFAGYTTMEAKNGKEGLAICKSETPNIVIVDYHMPQWDGMTTVKHIRALDQTVSILVLTVDERQEISDQFIELGATDFAIKPIKAPDLIARLGVNFKINEINRQREKDRLNMYIEKGISPVTLMLISDFLVTVGKPLTIEEITSGVSLAYQTVHRYIQHMISQEMIEVNQVYGQLGRPKNQYQINGTKK